MEVLLAIGAAIGLASVSGLRAFLPIGIAGVFAMLGLYTLPAPYDVFAQPLPLLAVFVLAVVESLADKVPALDTASDLVTFPLRILSGAALFATATGAGLGTAAIPELVAGGGIAGAVAALKFVLRPSANVATAGVSAPFLSAFEDVVTLVGAVVAIFVPLLTLLFVAFLLFFFYRIRRRRGRKYEGLRILGD
ncbi:protein of unknown function (DUF4126) [Rubrobacter radiotolerans]|uniref:DUF4126 domain-containing protein n=1 Tax=Rubrobacter radiotolerans TaxID=42256 RepID=A0A023X0C7_RUBRA|nr:DUF4126 domain-containing protein [Rubrobacter radiotolerans]AHY45932.1 protein of unknown function (DUF4126) [Rubrobacter radiotolerans]MDX5893346.1 DUF4126 domain-containing protein [Rubrobacter radiotolerans]SMC03545.1 protein of unknown function [Rubrobacter radiotolerans DSM 5868]